MRYYNAIKKNLPPDGPIPYKTKQVDLIAIRIVKQPIKITD